MSIQSQLIKFTIRQKVDDHFGDQLIPLYWKRCCGGKKTDYKEISKHEMSMVEREVAINSVRHFNNVVVKRSGEHFQYPSNLTEEKLEQAKYAYKYALKIAQKLRVSSK